MPSGAAGPYTTLKVALGLRPPISPVDNMDGLRNATVTLLRHNSPVSYRDLLQKALDQGLSLERALEFLRSSGASPVEAAAAVRDTTRVSLEEARQIVARSRAWVGPRSGAQPGGAPREWYGAIGQHGRSGRGAASVLPHLARQPQAQPARGRPA